MVGWCGGVTQDGWVGVAGWHAVTSYHGISRKYSVPDIRKINCSRICIHISTTNDQLSWLL